MPLSVPAIRRLLPLVFLAACGDDTPPFTPELPEVGRVPLGLSSVSFRIPPSDPLTPERVALGWQLFYDARLSSDGTVSCASCHKPAEGFGDARPVSLGVNDTPGRRNAPPIANAAFAGTQFWDGRAASLEDQARDPLLDPAEMANTEADLTDRLEAIPGYVQQFEAVFGTPEVTLDRIVRAIATFERAVLSGNAPWDRWTVNGDSAAVSDAAHRGAAVFEDAGCDECHKGALLTDFEEDEFHNIGVGMDAASPDLGRFDVTGVEADRGAFKTPGLRNLTLTAPYMHDGSQATLEEVVDFYNDGGIDTPWLSSLIQPLGLTDREQADLVAFMEALTGEFPEWAVRVPPLPPNPGSGEGSITGTR